VCFLQQLRAGVADDGAELLVDAQVANLEIDVGDADGRVLERAAEALLALAPRLLGALAVGNVPRQGHEESSVALPESFVPDLNREDRPVLAPVSGFKRDRLSFIELANAILNLGEGDIGVEVERGHPEQLVTGVAQARARLAVHVQSAAWSFGHGNLTGLDGPAIAWPNVPGRHPRSIRVSS
jgi:hypothetical protein